MIGGPAVAAVGAAGGALMGGWRDMLKIGVGFEFLDEASRELRPGRSAVVSVLDEKSETPLDSRMESIGGIVVRTRADGIAPRPAARGHGGADRRFARRC
jgi:uncharacterized membrane protein